MEPTTNEAAAAAATRALLPVILLNLLLAGVVLLKDLGLASYLGTSRLADAWFLAFFLPDAVGSSVLATALATATVPAFCQADGRKELVAAAARRLLGRVARGCGLLAGIAWLLRRSLLTAVAGQSGGDVQLATGLFELMLPLLLVAPLSAVGSGWLQATGRFTWAAAGPLLQNTVGWLALLLVGRLCPTANAGVWLLAPALTVGALGAGAWYVWGVRRAPAADRDGLTVCTGGTGQLAAVQPDESAKRGETAAMHEQLRHRLWPAVWLAGCAQLLLLGERYWALRGGAGLLSALNYAYRLAQFPLWTFVTAVAMVALPGLCRADSQQRPQLAGDSLQLVLLISLPAAMLLSTLATPLVSLLLQRGSFDQSSLRMTAGILSSYSLAIPALALNLMLQRICLAWGRLRGPLLAMGLATVVTCLSDGYLLAKFGPPGLGYGALLGALVNCLLLLWLLQRQGVPCGGRLRAATGRLVVAHLPLGLALLIARRLWPASAGSLFWLASVAIGSLLAWLAGLQLCGLLTDSLRRLGASSIISHGGRAKRAAAACPLTMPGKDG